MICVTCGIEFLPLRKTNTGHCSRKCLYKHTYKEQKKEYVCDCCGKTYTANKYNNNRRETNMCSESCRSTFMWRTKRKEHIHIDGLEYKKCCTCHEVKLVELFAKDKSKWDGLYGVCKDCYRTYTREVFSKTDAGIFSRKQSKANRRSVEKQAGKLTPQMIKTVYDKNIKEFGKLTCVYCKSECEEDWHLEHKNPLCSGGLNIEDNLTISCPSCNLSKGRKTEKEFKGIVQW